MSARTNSIAAAAVRLTAARRSPQDYGAVPKVREAIKLIEADGWREVRTKGSHPQFMHATKARRATIAGQPSDDLAPGTYNSILKQAGLKE